MNICSGVNKKISRGPHRNGGDVGYTKDVRAEGDQFPNAVLIIPNGQLTHFLTYCRTCYRTVTFILLFPVLSCLHGYHEKECVEQRQISSVTKGSFLLMQYYVNKLLNTPYIKPCFHVALSSAEGCGETKCCVDSR